METHRIDVTEDAVRRAILYGLLIVNEHNWVCLDTGCPAAHEYADLAKRAAPEAFASLLGITEEPSRG